MTDAFTLRPAGEADQGRLRALYHQVHGPQFALLHVAQRGPLLDMQYDIQCRAYPMQFPGIETLVIACGGAFAGRLLLHRDGPALRVVDIALDAQARGRGLGGAVLAQVQEYARAAGPGASVSLAVRPGNPARRLYRRLGFSECGGSEDDVTIHMVWRPQAAPPASA